MKRSTLLRRLSKSYLLSFLLLLALNLSPALAEDFSDIVLLGDSLSDSGNVFIATQGAVPPDPYFMGRFSNGSNYADQLSAALGSPLVPSLPGGTNFAFGGARTDSHPSGAPFDLLAQLNMLKASGYPISEETLVIFFGGTNNLQDIIAAAVADPANALAIGKQGIDNAIGDIRLILNELVAAGAKHLLVPNAPDLGLTPRVRELQPVAPWVRLYTKKITLLFNYKLARVLDELEGVEVYRFDTYQWLNKLVWLPWRYGLTNVSERCYTGDDLTFSGGGEVCANPDQYIFWDGIHPTERAHGILADQLLQLLKRKARTRHQLIRGPLLLPEESLAR